MYLVFKVNLLSNMNNNVKYSITYFKRVISLINSGGCIVLHILIIFLYHALISKLISSHITNFKQRKQLMFCLRFKRLITKQACQKQTLTSLSSLYYNLEQRTGNWPALLVTYFYCSHGNYLLSFEIFAYRHSKLNESCDCTYIRVS